MKKIIPLVISGLISLSAFSQIKFLVEAGINTSAPAFEGELYDTSPKEAKAGFTISAGIVNKLGKSFQLHNRVSFIRKNFQNSIFYGFGGTNDYRLMGCNTMRLLKKT